jgi:uncharacterized membrane protein
MGNTSQPPTVADPGPVGPRNPRTGTTPTSVRRNVQTIADLEAKSSAARRTLDRLSDRVSDFAGSPWFLLIHLLWFVAWTVANTLARKPVDPYPFTFLTFLVSLEAIFLTSFVLISQNHMEAQAHRRAALDLQIDLLAEQEMTSVLRTVTAIATHLGLPSECSAEDMHELIEQTDIAAVARTVDRSSQPTPESSEG